MRVLVIENDRKVATFIQTGLEQEGYAVDVLNDGAEAGDQASTIDNKIDKGFAVPLIHTIRGVGYVLTDTPS